MRQQNNTLPDAVPSSLADEALSRKLEDFLHHEKMRSRVKDIIAEYVDSIPFAKKIKAYSEEQIQISVYQSIGFWIKTILIPIVVTVISAVLMKMLNFI